MTVNKARPANVRTACWLAVLSAFPASLLWSAARMNDTGDIVTRFGTPVDAATLWAFAFALAGTGAWVVIRVAGNEAFVGADRLLRIVGVAAFFVSSCVGLGSIAMHQEQLLKEIAGK